MKRTYIALAMLVAVGATAFAEVQKESATDGAGCFARWDATTLEVGNDAFTRSYIANGDRLRTVSFKTSAGRELIVAGNARAKGTLLVRGETARRSPTGAEGLVLHVTVGSESLVLRLWPSVPGVLVEWGRVRPLPEITGIEAPDAYRLKMRRSWKLFSTASSVSDPLLLAPDYLRITEYVLFDQTDCRNDLVKTMQRLVPSCQLTEEIRVTSLDVRDIASAAGLAFLRLAPMPESRPTDVPDFVVHAEDRGLAPLANGYPLAELAYEGGEAGRIRALQNLQRALRPYRAGRDGVFLSNTWGDGNRDLRINAEFLAKEVDAAAELGVDVIQIDDGWQRGRTANTGKPLLPGIPKSWGDFWDTDPRFWEPDAERFPQGLKPLADAAKAKGLGFGLWFGPDSTDDLRNWERDADCLLAFWRELGVRYFKIDSLSITSPVGMERNRKFFDKMLTESNADMVFDLDCTAALRPGYFGLPDIGPLFLENRYARKGGRLYRPHQTLRNLWWLAHVVDPVRLRLELLNPCKGRELYRGDPLAPERWPADALFAIAMSASPLAWMELSDLTPETLAAWKPLVATWKRERAAFHGGTILPIGDEPDGWSWTGFLSVANDASVGYALIFRELSADAEKTIDLSGGLPMDVRFSRIERLGGRGEAEFGAAGTALRATIPASLDFIWLRLTP